MKKFLLFLIFFGLTLIVKSQNASVEKSTYGIQTGSFGVWIHNETKLSNKIALRSELGLDSGILAGSYYDRVGFLMTPVVTLEPRWYYNLNQRASKSKNIAGNSGNFLSLKTSYNPDWFTVFDNTNLKVIDQISIIPTWGMRRQIGKHFMYETGIGIGYRHIFSKNSGYTDNKSEAAVNLHLRIGYRF
ncbi:hypothetical protein [Flavivirga eckloniae]|uniref:DUF3575 domain-containing protein n=1 Tax=Flavivirga eckloniae TaxID=1803846 RepID=A0A2K9PNC9_9FLAO|nr:hypothetical protein [Flavivirga eckloniae]AUP78097.1 hypothetical protein C1H87_04950 [Flavivirga eckloniae]